MGRVIVDSELWWSGEIGTRQFGCLVELGGQLAGLGRSCNRQSAGGALLGQEFFSGAAASGCSQRWGSNGGVAPTPA